MNSLRGRVANLEVRRMIRSSEPVEVVIAVKGETEIMRATVCDPVAGRWQAIEREPDKETEIVFVQRVRELRVEHGGYICWGGLKEPVEWQQ